MNFRLIGAAAVSFMLATPAMAMHHVYRRHHGYIHTELSVRNAPGFGYGSTDRAYNFYPGDKYEYAPEEDYSTDFDRKNTFN